jgi:myo-inositol-1(or 4)-monophosphatase
LRDDNPGAAPVARDLALLIEAVREAGQLAKTMSSPTLKQWTKSGSSPVSDADIAVDLLLKERLHVATPAYGWLSEESVDDQIRLMRPRTWIVDPIDGTRAYLAGRSDWSVSAALVENERPLIGVVYAPATEEFFVAIRGRGATLNDQPIATTPGTDIHHAKTAGPRRLLDQFGVEDSVNPRIGSLALRLSRVAAGTLDVAFAGGQSRDWDLAAADLLIHEAGGRLTTLGGHDLTYNRAVVSHETLIAAGRERHAMLLARGGSGT